MIVNGKAERIPSIKEENMIDFMLKDQLDSKPSPRVLNTHLHPNFLPEVLLKNNKIIFIARNPKSVVVSYYRHMWSIDLIQYDGNFHSFFEMFMDGNVPTGDYFEYTRQWWSVIKDNPNVLIITYEEASKDLVKIVSLIAKFLGKKIDEQLTKDIADMCTFDRMKNEKPSSKENVFKIDFKDNNGFFRSGEYSVSRYRYTCMYVHVYVHVCACVCLYEYICVYTCVYTCVWHLISLHSSLLLK
ncbi:sulfotransferase 1E1 [Octopus bimaculoides]|nr:sulfotransferase 1E1 [Octopus bimaculoides]